MSRLLRLLIGVACLGMVGCQGHAPAPGAGSPSPPPAVEVQVATVRIEDMPRRLSTVGSFRPVTETNVSPRSGGVVVEVPVVLGQRVSRGQVLLQQDPVDARLQIGQDLAQEQVDLAQLGGSEGVGRPDADAPAVRKARANLNAARLEWERSQNLYRANLIAEAELQTAKRNYLTAQADLQTALDEVRTSRARLGVSRSTLRADRQKLVNLTTRAPFEGYISQVNVAVGDYASAGGSGAGGGPYLRLTQLDPIDCRLNIAQVEAARLRLGQPVRIRTEAFPGRTFSGQVVHINPSLDEKTRTVQVDARLGNAEGLLRPGFFGNVDLQVGVRRGVALVPQAAVIRAVGGSQVFVVEGSSARAVVVDAGEVRGEWLVLKDANLRPGQRVAVSSLDRLFDGAPVSVRQGGVK